MKKQKVEKIRPEIYINIGVLYHKTGQFRNALKSLLRAQRINENFMKSHVKQKDLQMAKVKFSSFYYQKIIIHLGHKTDHFVQLRNRL